MRNVAALAGVFAAVSLWSPAFAITPPTDSATGDAAVVAQAATDTATVSGNVHDTSGAPIAGARVTLTGATTMSVTTSSDGSFLISVSPGVYRVDVSKGGFLGTSLQHYSVATGSSTPLSVSLSQADLSSLRTIGQTSAASRGTSVNTGAATTNFLPAQTFTNLANPQINDVLQRLPDVTIQHMGSQPDTSIIVGGVQPYETQVLIDGHPLALGQYGVWTSQYYPSYLIGGVETESGPGNTTPFANLAVGGTVNLLTPGFTRNQTADLTYGVDNYGAQYSHFATSGAAGPVQYVAALGVDGTNGPYGGTTKCIVTPDFAGSLDNKPGNRGIITDCQDATGSFFNKGEALRLRFNFSSATSFDASFVGAWGGYNPQGTAWGTFLGQTKIEPCLTTSPLKCTSAKYSGLTGSTIDGFGWYTGSSVYNNQTLFDGQFRTTFANNTLLIRPYVGNIEPEIILGSGQTSNPAFYGPAPGSANYAPPSFPNGATIPATFNAATDGNAFEKECANNYDNVPNQLGKSVIVKGQQECFGGAYTTFEQDKLYGTTISLLHPIGTGVMNLTYDFHGQSTFAYINNPLGVSVPFSTDRYSTFSLTGTAQVAHNLNIDGGLYDTLWKVVGVKPASVTDATLVGFDRAVSRFDPHIALVYHPVSSVSYRAAWGTSATFPFVGQVSGLATFQTPAQSLGPPFAQGGTLTEKNSDLAPEVSTAYDVGVDKRFGNASLLSFDIGDTTIHNVFETLTTSTINPQTGGLEGIFSPVNVARLRTTQATLKYGYAPFSGFGFNIAAAAERSILDGLPDNAFSAGTASVPVNSVQLCGNGVAAPGIATCIPYLKGYGQFTYTARDRSFASIGVDYEGKNNAYFQPPFAMVDATYRRAVSRNAELQISAQNALNTNNYGSYLAMPGLGTPLVAGTLTAKGALAQTSFVPTLVSAPPRQIRVQLRLHMGR